jgi:hypothetical protein
VLCLHFPLKNSANDRQGSDQDVLNLQRCFENYQNVEFQAVHPQKPIEILLDQRSLDEIFKSSTIPDVFILLIVAHGEEDGTIFTDNAEYTFTTFQVWDALKSNNALKGAVKIIFFGVSWQLFLPNASIHALNI